MRGFLFGVCIISALTATVCSLACMTCTATSSYRVPTCYWNSKTCEPQYDSCASIQTVTGYDVGYKTSSYDMKCMESKNCNKTTTATLLGYEFKVVTSCCNTDNCTTEANLSPKNSTKNGVFCPACYDRHKAGCQPNAFMACTGDETSCISYANELKGCGTPDTCRFIGVCEYIDKGSPLSVVNNQLCTTCHTSIDECYSYPVHCANGEVCLTEKIWTLGGEENDFEFIRRCGKAAECSRVGTYRSNSKKFAINTTCCNSSMCVPPVPTFPTQEATENGLSCPTCFASNSIRCTEEDAMKCVGNENRCIHYVKNEYFKNNWQAQSFSGCTTDSICRLGSSTKQFYYLTNGTFKTVTMEMTCSGSMRVTVQFFSYVVIVFVGLRTVIVAL